MLATEFTCMQQDYNFKNAFSLTFTDAVWQL